MFEPDQYELLDFGGGRKLERFGDCLLDRPAPAAGGVPKAQPRTWQRADARFVRSDPSRAEGSWSWITKAREVWTIRHGQLKLEVRPGNSGQVGIFPEQAVNWDWISARLSATQGSKVLNLFAYTGGSTLAATCAGAEVVHVDSARRAVQWARRNAERSGRAAAPIRWIVEDVRTFVQRERRRGQRYDAVILDPPSYGHGPNGEPWKIDRHLPELLHDCAQLTEASRDFLLLTAHTSGQRPQQLMGMLRSAVDGSCGQVTGRALQLTSSDGRGLPAGNVACWAR